jgi:hypothetical protein
VAGRSRAAAADPLGELTAALGAVLARPLPIGALS